MNNNKPLISVIVLVYNNYRLLESNLSSINKQDYDNIEVIVSDDCSKEFDETLVRSWIDSNKISNTLFIVNKSNLGTVKNYNNAIKKSHGEIILPLSADDAFYSNHYLSDLASFFLTYDPLICYSKRIGSLSKNIYPNKRDEKLIIENVGVLDRLCFGGLFSGASLSYKRSFFDIFGFFNEEYSLLDDHPKTIEVYKKGYKIEYINTISIVYGEEGQTGITKKPSRRLANDYIKLYKDILNDKDLCKVISRKCKRFVKYQIDKLSSNSKIRYALIHIKHLYITIYKILFVFRKNKDLDFYWFYIGDDYGV